MIASRFFRLLVAAALATGASVSSLAVAGPAAAACTRDPYSHACVTPARIRLHAAGRLAAQRQPRTGSTLRRISGRASVGAICQVTNGGGVRGYRSRTWVAITGGGWVFAAQAGLRVGSNGLVAGVRGCGTSPARVTLVATSPLNAGRYPWPAQNGWAGDGHGYWQGECVSFAAWAVRSDGLPHTASTEWLGDARRWHAAYVDRTPHVGDVAQWDAFHNGADSYGHVAYVAAVYSDGSVTVWEYNWNSFHRFHTRTITAGTPSRYLHF